MPWVRFGDTAATYPKLLQIRGYPGADARLVNEVRGWLNACATQSGGHLTDYAVDYGTAELFGGTRTKKLIAWCVRAGLLSEHTAEDGSTYWLIIADPDFIHIRTKAEIEADRQRKADRANTSLTVPVRLRDGDNCRYCSRQVMWTGKTSNRSAELDHRDQDALAAGKPATIETLVVACKSCNCGRQDDDDWDLTHPLLPPPKNPNYSDVTARFLTKNGHPTETNIQPDETRQAHRSTDTAADQARPEARPPATSRPGPGAPTRRAAQSATAETRPAPSWATGTGQEDAAATPPTGHGDPPETPRKLRSNGVSGSAETGSGGSGRDGDRSAQRARRKRGGRGRRRPASPPPSPEDGS